MSVPEGKMRLQLERREVWTLQLALRVALSDYPYPGESLSGRLRPILGKLIDYLEATDGPQPATYVAHPTTEEDLGGYPDHGPRVRRELPEE